jgi:hypothetical protein
MALHNSEDLVMRRGDGDMRWQNIAIWESLSTAFLINSHEDKFHEISLSGSLLQLLFPVPARVGVGQVFPISSKKERSTNHRFLTRTQAKTKITCEFKCLTRLPQVLFPTSLYSAGAVTPLNWWQESEI